MDIAETAKVLNDLYAQQYQDNLAANEANRRLADEQISYGNEARGTYYSGIPTWQRAQNAVSYADKANTINLNYANQATNLWNNISDYYDKINAYNEAAGVAAATAPTQPATLTSAPFIINGVQYVYRNGKLTRV
jgi:hypothetical protein